MKKGKLILLNFYACLTLPALWADEQVVLSTVILYHGRKISLTPYPTDPYKDSDLFTSDTEVNFLKYFDLGTFLGQRYSVFLPIRYSALDVYIQSIDDDNALSSTESFLQGLFPPITTGYDYTIQFIPIHTSRSCDEVLKIPQNCTRYTEILETVDNSSYVKCISLTNAEAFNYIRQMTGNTLNTVNNLQMASHIYEVLKAERAKNYNLPSWTDLINNRKLESWHMWQSMLRYSSTRELQKISVGLLMGEIVEQMLRKENRTLTPDRKMYIYSVEDRKFSSFMQSLGVLDAYMIPSAAALLLELVIGDDKKHRVKVLYRNSTEYEPHLLTIPGCAGDCTLSRFANLTSNIIPTNWTEECDGYIDKGMKLDFILPHNGNTIGWKHCFGL